MIGIESPDCIQVVLHPALQEAFRRWLAERDLHLYQIPGLDPDDLPTYAVGVGRDTERTARTELAAAREEPACCTRRLTRRNP